MAGTKDRSVRSLRLVALALALGAAACGGDDDPVPTKKTTSDAGPTTKPSLSKAFKNNCASCHGEEGEGSNGVPSLPGKLSQSQFIATVRSGTNEGMPSFKTSVISDADLKSDYAVLKTLNE